MANKLNAGQRVRAYRKARGWSLAFLAQILGTTKGHLSEVERGLKNPGPPLKKRTEILIGIPVGDWPVEVAEEVAQHLAEVAQAAAGGSR